MFLSFRIFEQLALALKTEFVLATRLLRLCVFAWVGPLLCFVCWFLWPLPSSTGVPNGGTCTPRGTFAYRKGYI